MGGAADTITKMTGTTVAENKNYIANTEIISNPKYCIIMCVFVLTPADQTRDEHIMANVGVLFSVHLQPQQVEQCLSKHPEHIDDAEVVEETRKDTTECCTVSECCSSSNDECNKEQLKRYIRMYE